MTERPMGTLAPATFRFPITGLSSSPSSAPPRDRGETRGHEQPGFAIASPTEVLLRGLLGASGRSDAEASVVEGVRTLLGAQWAALFEPQADEWVCLASSGSGPVRGEGWRLAGQGGAESAPVAGRLVGPAGESAELGVELEPGSEPVLLLVGVREDRREDEAESRRLLERVAPDLTLALQKGDELDTLRSQAFVDALTGCYNRRGFDEHLHVELLRAQRYGRSTALMLTDLDGFKSINDELGHQAGDHALRRFCALLTGTFRNTDVVSRYGGDEFAVIFPETNSAEAVQLADRVRALLGEAFPDALLTRTVTASFGIAAYPQDAESAEELIATADHALYAAKAGGRDRIVASPSGEE